MAYLALLRHGQTDYNKKGLWTGETDVSINAEGANEAKKAARSLSSVNFDYGFSGTLKRTKETLSEITSFWGKEIETHESEALNERDYGDFTGKNKWEIREKVGEEEFKRIRRSWDYPIPNGESLKDVYKRVVPYFEAEIAPLLRADKNVLIVSSGNTIRALAKFLEKIPDEKIAELEFQPGEVILYEIEDSRVLKKEILNKSGGKF